jgi:hypothetical protein
MSLIAVVASVVLPAALRGVSGLGRPRLQG